MHCSYEACQSPAPALQLFARHPALTTIQRDVLITTPRARKHGRRERLLLLRLIRLAHARQLAQTPELYLLAIAQFATSADTELVSTP